MFAAHSFFKTLVNNFYNPFFVDSKLLDVGYIPPPEYKAGKLHVSSASAVS